MTAPEPAKRWSSAPASATRRRPGCWPTESRRRPLICCAEHGTAASGADVELAPLAVDIARATVDGIPGVRATPGGDRAGRGRRRDHRRQAGLQSRDQRPVQVVRRRARQRPAGRQAVLLAATAGSSRHALVIDNQMRPMFAYIRALTLPTSVFAAPEDWAATELRDRIDALRPSSQSCSTPASDAGSSTVHGPAISTSSPATPPGRAHRRRRRLRFPADAARRRRPIRSAMS